MLAYAELHAIPPSADRPIFFLSPSKIDPGFSSMTRLGFVSAGKYLFDFAKEFANRLQRI